MSKNNLVDERSISYLEKHTKNLNGHELDFVQFARGTLVVVNIPPDAHEKIALHHRGIRDRCA